MERARHVLDEFRRNSPEIKNIANVGSRVAIAVLKEALDKIRREEDKKIEV